MQGHSFCLLLQLLGGCALQQAVLPALHCSSCSHGGGYLAGDEMAGEGRVMMTQPVPASLGCTAGSLCRCW